MPLYVLYVPKHQSSSNILAVEQSRVVFGTSSMSILLYALTQSMGHFSHENVPAGTPMHKCMQDTDFFIQVAFQNLPSTKQVTTGIDHTSTC